jgi:hypothetical protein
MAILKSCGALIGQIDLKEIERAGLCVINLSLPKRHGPMVA